MKSLLFTLCFSLFIVFQSTSQIDPEKIIGIWSFDQLVNISKHCEVDTNSPIKELIFISHDNVFSILSNKAPISGTYGLEKDILILSNATQGDEKLKTTQKIKLIKLTQKELILEFPNECGLQHIKFKRKK